jgi:putative peptidoglycan lipid II flippase
MFKFVKNLITGRNSISQASVLIALFSLASRLLGLVRDRIFAAKFGAGVELDAYFAAFRVPDFIFNLLIVGALSAAFIPVFTRYMKRQTGEEADSEQWLIANSVLNLVIVLWVIVGGLVAIFARPLLHLLVPGFEGQQFELTVALTRIMIFSPLFFGISNVAGSILNSYRRFFVFALAPVLYNLGIIIAALLFIPRFGIYALALGVVLGAFLHMLVQTLNTYYLGFRYSPILQLSHVGVRRICQLALPRIGGMAVNQVNLIVQTVIGSTLLAGVIASINFANNLQSIPVGLFGVAMATAVFPTLAEQASLKRRKKFIDNFSKIARTILFLTIPATVLLFLLRAQIVRVILGAGHFGWRDTIITAQLLGYFAISLFAQALYPLLTRAFYALEDTWTPLRVAIASVSLNIVLSYLLTRDFGGWLTLDLGPIGLVLAFSISMIFQAILLLILLRKKIKNIDGTKILLSTVKIVIASILAGLIIQSAKYLSAPFLDIQTGTGILTQATIASLAGIGSYLLMSWILNCQELQLLFRWLPKGGIGNRK